MGLGRDDGRPARDGQSSSLTRTIDGPYLRTPVRQARATRVRAVVHLDLSGVCGEQDPYDFRKALADLISLARAVRPSQPVVLDLGDATAWAMRGVITHLADHLDGECVQVEGLHPAFVATVAAQLAEAL